MPNLIQTQPLPLKELHTFGLDYQAKSAIVVETEAQLQQIIQQGAGKALVLGEGSNSIFLSDYHGLLLVNRLKGIHLDLYDDHVIVRVASGESWHDLVTWTIDQGYGGLENLALIPGTVGGAPVQNIGAYGVEFSSFCHAVHEVDLNTGESRRRLASDCHFGYRTSRYKQLDLGTCFITEVEIKLAKQWQPEITYGPLSALEQKVNLTPLDVMNRVIQIRQSKLPNTQIIGNAGSFFKNPSLSTQTFDALRQIHPTIPGYSVDKACIKVPAAWLIDSCGMKGVQWNQIAVCETQALVLIHYGAAQGEDLIGVAKHIQDRVHEAFGVSLEPEVHFYAGEGPCYPI
jgi:UDP-N-acetylmuramate dehydrogenase